MMTKTRAVIAIVAPCLFTLAACLTTVEDHREAAEATPLCGESRGECDGDPATLCEVDLTSHNDHCGACGQACQHGSCLDGSCVCRESFADCDTSAVNGCEVDLRIDSQHCGACGRSCLGDPCVAGVCQPVAIASDRDDPWDIAVSDDRVFWSEYDGTFGTDVIFTAPKDGSGAPEVLVPDPYPRDLLVHNDSLYWLSDDRVRSLDLLSPEEPPETVATGDGMRRLQIGPSRVFWISEDDELWAASKGEPNGPPELIAESIWTMAIDETFLYWHDGNTITRMDLSTAQTVGFADIGPCYALATAGDAVYCARTDGLLMMSEPGSPALSLITFDENDCPWEILFDDEALYWVGGGGVTRLYRSGGQSEVIAKGQPGMYVFGLALDSQRIYWTTISKIMRLSK